MIDNRLRTLPHVHETGTGGRRMTTDDLTKKHRISRREFMWEVNKEKEERNVLGGTAVPPAIHPKMSWPGGGTMI